MEGASVTVGGGAGFLINDASPQAVLRQQQGSQHSHRPRPRHNDFRLSVIRHNWVLLLKENIAHPAHAVWLCFGKTFADIAPGTPGLSFCGVRKTNPSMQWGMLGSGMENRRQWL